ncbi:hypothetical protein [Aulosira sp. FACHB-615]|uniref:hypothetical protein n=1 Tax=Aulosira sp. FACHB-615 TaxID=2692777 RepID=UPI001685E52E|nr:hypothetical protein [Aulosira sp. FACHB-615]MBD2486436.1 hypothetical protein [Aulosira sp. FACHB-615]
MADITLETRDFASRTQQTSNINLFFGDRTDFMDSLMMAIAYKIILNIYLLLT